MKFQLKNMQAVIVTEYQLMLMSQMV